MRAPYTYDRTEECRRAAAECLEAARNTPDIAMRAALVTMAQRWFERANGSERQEDELLPTRPAPQLRKH